MLTTKYIRKTQRLKANKKKKKRYKSHFPYLSKSKFKCNIYKSLDTTYNSKRNIQ